MTVTIDMTRQRRAVLTAIVGGGMLLVGLAVAWGMRWTGERSRRLDVAACENLKDKRACDRACARGLAAGCYLAAEALKGDRDRRPDALSLYERGCVGGDPRACRALGFVYRDGDGGSARDVPRALERFARGCDGDDATACYELGSMYYSAWGVKQDAARAVALFDRSCAAGYAHGCARAGASVVRGEGIAPDLVRARTLLERGCTLHDAAACAELGSLYEWGWNQYPPKDRDREKARHFYKLACQGGESVSCESVDALSCEDAGGVSLARSPVLQHFVAAAGIDACRPCRVLRMEMDVTGDDQPELFLSGSCLAGNAGSSWYIYTRTPPGTYRCLGRVFFHFEGFRFDRDRSLLIGYHRMGGGDGGFEYYRLGTGGVQSFRASEVVSTDSPAFREEWGRIERWLPLRPSVTGADLKELSARPDTVWMTQEYEGKPYPRHAPLSAQVDDAPCPEPTP